MLNLSEHEQATKLPVAFWPLGRTCGQPTRGDGHAHPNVIRSWGLLTKPPRTKSPPIGPSLNIQSLIPIANMLHHYQSSLGRRRALAWACVNFGREDGFCFRWYWPRPRSFWASRSQARPLRCGRLRQREAAVGGWGNIYQSNPECIGLDLGNLSLTCN